MRLVNRGRRPRTRRRPTVAALLAAAALVVLAGCGDDATTTAAGTGDLSSYDDIDELHEQLVDAGIECGLEYEGLRDDGREVSICVIEGEQALLTVWDDPALVAEFAESEAAAGGEVAYGENWTVDLDSNETAQLVADALGGTVAG